MIKAVFLDRDGIINIDYGYVSKIDQLDFCNGIFSLTDECIRQGFQLFIVTNQSGIARGYFNNSQFIKLMDYILEKFQQQNCPIIDYRFCPHLPTDFCSCRKPKPNMIFDLAKTYQIDLTRSLLIGDKMSDILCGVNAGVGRNFLVSTDTTEISLPDTATFHSDLRELLNSLALKSALAQFE